MKVTKPDTFLQRAIRERELARLEADYADGEEDGDPEGGGIDSGSDGDFLGLEGGRVWVRKFHVDAVAWERDPNAASEPRLRILMGGLRYTAVGEEAAEVMRQLGLPEDPP